METNRFHFLLALRDLAVVRLRAPLLAFIERVADFRWVDFLAAPCLALGDFRAVLREVLFLAVFRLVAFLAAPARDLVERAAFRLVPVFLFAVPDALLVRFADCVAISIGSLETKLGTREFATASSRHPTQTKRPEFPSDA